MNEKHLHVISFDVPYPANYGGVIDVYYRIKALSEKGVKVHLHCFEYGRSHQDVLEETCFEVHYYKRDLSFAKMLSRKPYFVKTRQSEDLVHVLLQDRYPILCEGLHTTAILGDKRLKDRKIYVRAHNVEHDYYRALACAERKIWKRVYYWLEAIKAERYEPILDRADGIFAISQQDAGHFSERFSNVCLLPGFNGFDKVCSEAGRGVYLLYHGNLSVMENAKAVKWLIENVFSKVDFPCVIAGLRPSDSLRKLASVFPNVSLFADPNEDEMIDLLRQAQVNVLVTHQSTGLKLKLLNALFNGRFCLVNSAMVKGTALESLCVVADDPEQMIDAIKRLMITDFTHGDIEKRDARMRELYHNETNAQLLIDCVFGR